MVELFRILPPVPQSLLAGRLPQKVRLDRRPRPQVVPGAQGLSRQVHLRAMERPAGDSTEGSASFYSRCVSAPLSLAHSLPFSSYSSSTFSLLSQKCIIGIDYPQPIVDAKAAQASAVARIKSAFAVKMQGDDPRVLDGTWIQVLRDAYEASPGKVAAVEVQGGTAEKPKRLNPFEQAKAGGSTPKKAKKK